MSLDQAEALHSPRNPETTGRHPSPGTVHGSTHDVPTWLVFESTRQSLSNAIRLGYLFRDDLSSVALSLIKFFGELLPFLRAAAREVDNNIGTMRRYRANELFGTIGVHGVDTQPLQ